MFTRVEFKAYKRQYNASNYCADKTIGDFDNEYGNYNITS